MSALTRNQIEMPDSWVDELAPGASAKKKFPSEQAAAVAAEIVARLLPVCERIIVAGSLRRRKAEVGDVEILYIPRTAVRPLDFFATETVNLADEELARMLSCKLIEKRTNKLGSEVWGAKNKLARHAGGIPVDFFSATAENWWNYLVCRTGGAENNVAIASAAQRKGWKWNPYGSGFSRGGALAGESETHAVTSEEEVFAFVGLPWREPWERA